MLDRRSVLVGACVRTSWESGILCAEWWRFHRSSSSKYIALTLSKRPSCMLWNIDTWHDVWLTVGVDDSSQQAKSSSSEAWHTDDVLWTKGSTPPCMQILPKAIVCVPSLRWAGFCLLAAVVYTNSHHRLVVVLRRRVMYQHFRAKQDRNKNTAHPTLRSGQQHLYNILLITYTPYYYKHPQSRQQLKNH